MFTIACVIALVVSIALAFAWKFRCAVMRSTSSAVRSTFERSREPALRVPKPAEPGSPKDASPESEVAKKAGISDLSKALRAAEIRNNYFPERLLASVGIARHDQAIITDILRRLNHLPEHRSGSD